MSRRARIHPKGMRPGAAKRRRLKTPPRRGLGEQSLESQMQCHLQETRAADGVLDQAEFAAGRADITHVRSAVLLAGDGKRSRVLRRICKVRIEFHVVVGGIEARMVEDVERLNIKLQPEALADPEILENADVHARLE